MNRISVDVSLSNEGVGRRSSILTKNTKNEDALIQSGGGSGVYFSNGKSKLVRTIDIHSSQGFIASSSQTDRPFVSNPQFAPNDVADGGDPGGDPAGPPLPLKDNLIILLLLSIIYVIKKSRLK